MAETKILEREYVIPLRKFWLRVPQYQRSGKAIKAIKSFIAKHMKVSDRDPELVKLDTYFNNELWYRGRASPPSKVKVKARKEDEIVYVTFVKEPEHVKFLKAKHSRRHSAPSEKPADKPAEQPAEQKPADKPAEKQAEKEKETAVAIQHQKEAKLDSRAQKHTTKAQKAQHPQRMALKK